MGYSNTFAALNDDEDDELEVRARELDLWLRDGAHASEQDGDVEDHLVLPAKSFSRRRSSSSKQFQSSTPQHLLLGDCEANQMEWFVSKQRMSDQHPPSSSYSIGGFAYHAVP